MKLKTACQVTATLFCVGLFILQSVRAIGQAAPTSAYKIVSDHRLVLTLPFGKTGAIDRFLLEDVTPCRAQDYVKPSYACTVSELAGTADIIPAYEFDESTSAVPAGSPMPIDQLPSSQMVIFNFPAGKLRGSRVYRLTYWQAPASGSNSPGVTTVNVDTSPTVSLSQDSPQRKQEQIYLISSLAYISRSPTGTAEVMNTTNGDCPAGAGGSWSSSTIHADPATKGPGLLTISALVHLPDTILNPEELDNAGRSPRLKSQANEIGKADLCVKTGDLKISFSISSSEANAVLSTLLKLQSPLLPPAHSGRCSVEGDLQACGFQEYDASSLPNWTSAQGTKLTSNAVQPTGKTDAGFYANVNLVAATGAKFAWGLDGKLSELQRQIGHSAWQITPLSATANTGNNTASIKGQTYSDSIDWTLPFSYEWDRIGSHPTTLVFVAAPDYSTDIEFDRKNMLADLHFILTPPVFYKTLQVRNSAVSGALWKYPNPSQHYIGGELQFQAGVEAGGAIVDTVQKASSGTAKITVPAYNVTRIVPQIHGLFQWLPAKSTKAGLFTFDETITGHYLTLTENTVEQYNVPGVGTAAPTVALSLRPRQGWLGYNSLVTTWYPPFSNNVGLTVTYNDGFNAPKFTRINSVVIGVTIIY